MGDSFQQFGLCIAEFMLPTLRIQEQKENNLSEQNCNFVEAPGLLCPARRSGRGVAHRLVSRVAAAGAS
jgi:hypothetical protein